MLALHNTLTREMAEPAGDVSRSRAYWNDYIDARGELYRDAWLANFEVEHAGQAAVIAAAREYCQTVAARVEAGQNVILFGAKGTGKDHILAAIVRQAIRATGRPAAWTSGAGLYARCKNTFDSRHDSDADIIRAALAAPVWSISDPTPVFGERLTRYEAEILYQIADGRANRRRPSFVTVNVLSREELDDTIGPKTADRLVSGALTAFCNWPSYRAAAVTANSPK